jgi:hypothetical protein
VAVGVWKLAPNMKPRSMSGFHARPPAASAFCLRAVTASRLSEDRAISTLVPALGSAIGPVTNSANLAWVSSMTKMFWSTTMQAAVWSLNCGFFSKPRAVKKATERSRSATGRLMKT